RSIVLPSHWHLKYSLSDPIDLRASGFLLAGQGKVVAHQHPPRVVERQERPRAVARRLQGDGTRYRHAGSVRRGHSYRSTVAEHQCRPDVVLGNVLQAVHYPASQFGERLTAAT